MQEGTAIPEGGHMPLQHILTTSSGRTTLSTAFLNPHTLPAGSSQEGGVWWGLWCHWTGPGLDMENQDQLSQWASLLPLALPQSKCWDVGYRTGFWRGWLMTSVFTTIINAGLSNFNYRKKWLETSIKFKTWGNYLNVHRHSPSFDWEWTWVFPMV